MTLVLALRYRDGIVLASDGQATSDAAGQPTRAPGRKIFHTASGIAWGSAGTAGLQQSVGASLAQVLVGRATDDAGDARSDRALRDRLAGAVIPVQQRALRDHVPVDGAAPPELACLFCWVGAGGPRIFTVPRTGADHQFHERHAAIGSGDIFAELTLRSIADLEDPALGVEEAKMIAYRAIDDAIDVAAVFLGPPIQLTVIDARGAHPVERAEIDGPLADAVALWRVRQRETLGPLAA